ncbi:MAG: hypothetical protein WC812_01840 [Candidatus Pacearchaeota archaeon]|jgi:hypothetical protein
MVKRLTKELKKEYEEINDLWKEVFKNIENKFFVNETKKEIDQKFNNFIAQFISLNNGFTKEMQPDYDAYCGNYFLNKGILEEKLRNYDFALRNYNLSKIFNPSNEEINPHLERILGIIKNLSHNSHNKNYENTL